MGDSTTATDVGGRALIGERVIKWAGIGIVSIAITAILCSTAPLLVTLGKSTDPGAISDAAEKLTSSVMTVFNSLLPMFGTWVGTVLAYYFAKENFSAAAQATKSLLSKAEEKLSQVTAESVQMPYDQITKIELDAGNDDAKVTVAEIGKKLQASTITRLPIFDANKAIKYLIHRGEYYRYIVEAGLVKDGGKLVDAQKREATLKDMADFTGMAVILKTFAVMGPGKTLADAKAAIDTTPEAEDLFITEDGSVRTAVLGWITNSDIAKKACV